MATPTTSPTGGRAMVSVFDGTRKLYSGDKDLFITARDGNQDIQSQGFHKSANVQFTGLPLFNNFGDSYSFLASASGYRDAGFFPVKLASNINQTVDLMLVPKSSNFNFANATWMALGTARPDVQTLFANGAADASAAENRYSDLRDFRHGTVLACLLNITTAMQQIQLSQGTPLTYLKQIIWDRDGQFAMAQDRFFAWADPKLIERVKNARDQTPKKFRERSGRAAPRRNTKL
jgi:hypothetical protein